LLNDDSRRERLAERIGALATPGAAAEVAGWLLGAVEEERRA
jgi:hypothetical protein